MDLPVVNVRFDAKWMNRQVINFVTINNNSQVMLWYRERVSIEANNGRKMHKGNGTVIAWWKPLR